MENKEGGREWKGDGREGRGRRDSVLDLLLTSHTEHI